MADGKVIFFIPEDAGSPDGLDSMMESISLFAAIEVARSLGSLREQLLQQAGQSCPIVIVLTPTKVDLEGLLEVQDLFENTRLILVLSDAGEEAVALGHRMRPRFIGYLANGFAEIAAVVQKMAAGGPRSGKPIRERRLRA